MDQAAFEILSTAAFGFWDGIDSNRQLPDAVVADFDLFKAEAGDVCVELSMDYRKPQVLKRWRSR